jgi:pimeloyl-ACP methyl ester carboxylesterase
MKELAEDVSVSSVESSGHWVAEENPEGFVEDVLQFFKAQNLI